jgi:hypothetical protein
VGWGLKELVDDSYINAFIGFGIDHDATLLNKLGDANEKSTNYFIDQLENAGLVYGEILHGFVYKLLENVEITVSNGLIYDFKTNTWNTKLKQGDIVGESIKYYHIISETPNTCKVNINGKKIENETEFDIVIEPNLSPADLTRYIYRQQTQQILYKINEYLKKTNVETDTTIPYMRLPNLREPNKYDPEEKQKSVLKSELCAFFEELKEYIVKNELQDDILLKNLCDDIYICHRTFGTEYGNMYCAARKSSQGNQRTYAVTQVPNVNCHDFGIQRSNVLQHYSNSQDPDYDLDNTIPPPVLLRHEVSDSLATPYRNSSNSRVMREISSLEN